MGGEKRGAIAQLGERQLCKLDVVGSIPTGSTKSVEVLLGKGLGVWWLEDGVNLKR